MHVRSKANTLAARVLRAAQRHLQDLRFLPVPLGPMLRPSPDRICPLKPVHCLTLAAILALGFAAPAAQAWQRPGHAASAALAYDDLAHRHPEIVRQVVDLMAAHPDRARFDAQLGDAAGEERDRRLFMAMARWPDDVRLTSYDHPSWHYWMSPYVSPSNPPPKPPEGGSRATIGEAREAFALNLAVASDPTAQPAERAVALCWVFHILQDAHQPLHAAQLFSRQFPDGDRGGTLGFVKTGPQAPATTFHRFWDERVLAADADLEAVEAKSRALAHDYPRRGLPELRRAYPAAARLQSWALKESFPLARRLAYDGGKVRVGSTPEAATVPAPAYQAASLAAAERRLALSGYRLADTLEAVLAFRQR